MGGQIIPLLRGSCLPCDQLDPQEITFHTALPSDQPGHGIQSREESFDQSENRSINGSNDSVNRQFWVKWLCKKDTFSDPQSKLAESENWCMW